MSEQQLFLVFPALPCPALRMPLQWEHLHLALLLLAVPAQYLAMHFLESNEVTRTYAISQLVGSDRRWGKGEPN